MYQLIQYLIMVILFEIIQPIFCTVTELVCLYTLDIGVKIYIIIIMFVFMYVVVTVWRSVGMFVV